MSNRTKAASLAGALLIAATSVAGVAASSHREAPLISGDPTADNTDVYAFVSPDAPDTLTIIANWNPNEEPAGGPNFYPFGDDVRYEIHIDNNGDGRDDVTYRFKFKKHTKATNFAGIPTFLYNDGPITSLKDENWLVPQTYKVWRNGNRISKKLRTPPANVGARSTPDYETNLGEQAVHELSNGTKVFAGQRDDAFFVDTGSIFDLLGLRPFNAAHVIPLDTAAGVDDISGFNTNSIALQVPIKDLTRNHKNVTNPNSKKAVVGVWASSSRKKIRVLKADGTVENRGKWRQISRLGNPLINEVVIPRVDKDYWNSQRPAGDSEFAKYYRKPEVSALINVLYEGTVVPARTSGRADLVAVLLTGLDLRDVGGPINLNKTGSTLADELRVNVAIKPNADGACVFGVDGGGTPSRLGVLEGDLCGFPNGRRLLDDVTDIEIRAFADGYGPVVNSFYGDLTPNLTPNNTLGDGVDENDMEFKSNFPYIASPHSGYEHNHEHGL